MEHQKVVLELAYKNNYRMADVYYAISGDWRMLPTQKKVTYAIAGEAGG